MKKFKLNRLTSIVITMAVMLSCGGYLFADDTEQPEVTEETAVEQVQEEPEVVEEPIEEEEVLDEEEPAEEEEPVESDDSVVEFTLTAEDYTCDDTGFDSDYLSEQYIMQEMSVGAQVSYSHYYNQSNLPPIGVAAYGYLYTQISAIADGRLADTEITIPNDVVTITFTPEELGLNPATWDGDSIKAAVAAHMPFDTSSMMNAFISGCPYELYWFDKSSTGGLGMHYSMVAGYRSGAYYVEVNEITFEFYVAREFRASEANPLEMNTTFGTSARAAAVRAQNIINAYTDYDDYHKLLAYNDAICDLVDYNTPASRGGVAYGNPWQMIWVFDGIDETNVVCEGYSKAFQYLCDNSTFSNPELYVISVSGTAIFTSNQGPHMWNIVHMDDGFNYLIDVTNNDTNDNKLFMLGASSGSIADGYQVTLRNETNPRTFTYIYESDMFDTFTSSALTLAPANYVLPVVVGASFIGHSMQLSGQIGLQFVVELPSGVRFQDCYMTFADDHNHVDSNEHHDLTLFSRGSYTGYYAQVNLSSIEMADNITPTLHYFVNGVEKVLVGNPYSARDYINWGLANLSKSSREYKIISALADYGHYSQPYLSRYNRWTNDGSVYSQMITYCTDSFVYYDVASAIPEDQRIHVNSLSGSGFNAVTYSLRFGDTISLRVFLKAEDITAIDNSLFTFTGGRTPVIGRDGDRVTITFNEIPATALTNIYTISYNDRSLVSVSPMSYVYGMLTSTETQDDGRDLVCALYYYAQACAVNN